MAVSGVKCTVAVSGVVHCVVAAVMVLHADLHTALLTGLGASWSKGTLRDVGRVLADEARGLHNGFLHAAPNGSYDARGTGCNGCGITLYSPNLNLVRITQPAYPCAYHQTVRIMHATLWGHCEAA